MKNFDVDGLVEYDMSNAKVGDKVLVLHWGRWREDSASIETIKTISPKRKEVAFDNDSLPKFKPSGYPIGTWQYDSSQYRFYVVNEEVEKKVKAYKSYCKVLTDTKYLINTLTLNGYEKIEDLSYEDLCKLRFVIVSLTNK